jgi:hypothetical protein
VELVVVPAGTHDGIVWTEGADSLRLIAEAEDQQDAA